ncbi:LAMI_0E12046g1_1 [Lachancea mirantina]|uniref:Phospholipase n=1 Tax=Lachancea mirantina TaxID=1230905 RepID=A0A1G4JPT7_9SACH|nr:LAMI_0E12046g1_1 [Lachancea mirantina]
MGQHTEPLAELECPVGDHNVPQDVGSAADDDVEAEYKNLMFQGVPNSSINAERDDQTHWLRRMNPHESFYEWKKEVGQAFRRISKLTAQKPKRTSVAKQGKSSAGQTALEEAFTRNLASDLIDTLLSGCPAALFAGGSFLRDEHGVRRASLLLAMLGVKVRPLQAPSAANNLRHMDSAANASDNSSILSLLESETNNSMYTLELEYGVGPNRMKWSVIKSYKDLASLHGKLKLISFQQNTINKLYIDHNRYRQTYLPHFPRLDDNARRGKKKSGLHRGRKDENTESGIPSPSADMASLVSSRASLQFQVGRLKMKHLEDILEEEDDYSQPMHLRLERYLRLLNLALSLRPQSNRLFQFYELSPIGNLLSYENGYQGKQGYMVVRSTARTQGWRVAHLRFDDLRAMVERHTNKWFLIRHSYITYVSDLCSTTPLDVFLVDSQFKVKAVGEVDGTLDTYRDFDPTEDKSKRISAKLLITLENNERKLQVIVKSEFLLKLWMASISKMVKSTIWSQPHRFDSFAPVRKNCFCKFFVDGRDYFWALSEAFSMAQDVIFIHDWWLSPELYMRRPVKGNQEFRIDRILRERAEKGVKIFIVVYRNVGTTVGTDSLWTKHSMLNLHPNIHLIRSPNQWLQNTYFWAHHEKMTVIDHSIAFMGGIDLCYGRFDTPEHVLCDETNDIQQQTFPGKDYSNARVCDFYDLDKPFESMYDRSVVPRMPWHDVHMMTVGEAARDMSRHFVQRWNYLLRQKRPTRPTPLLTPASDFTKEEMRSSPLFNSIKPRSTCEVQVLRSAGNWSLGLKQTEKSIQNAYLKLIETSQHFVYLENQFFVTSSSWDGVVVENKIGDALVDRIIKANSEGKPWKAFIVIPLMPGFNAQVDDPDGSSVRVIMQCQYQSISRGDTSIFARLRQLDIDPMQYIQFFSLRKWASIGPQERLVTEQLYVHGKVMIVDDRSCIIGSANVNERSMLGNRDSEVAALIRDTDLVESRMNGHPYLAGRFPWELRQRLMREHLGCDVDVVEIVERKFGKLEQTASRNTSTLNLLPEDEQNDRKILLSSLFELAYREVMSVNASEGWMKKFHNKNGKFGIQDQPHETNSSGPLDMASNAKSNLPRESYENLEAPFSNKHYHSFNNRAGEANLGLRDNKAVSTDPRLVNNEKHAQEVEGLGPDGWKKTTAQFKQNVTDKLRSWAEKMLSNGHKRNKSQGNIFLPSRDDVEAYLAEKHISDDEKWDMLKRICYLQHLSYKKEAKKPGTSSQEQQHNHDHKTASTKEVLHRIANAEVLDAEELDDDAIDELVRQIIPAVGNKQLDQTSIFRFNFVDPYAFEDPLADSFYEDMWFTIALRNTLIFRMVFHCQPDNAVQSWRDYKDFKRMAADFEINQDVITKQEQNGDKPGQVGQTKVAKTVSHKSEGGTESLPSQEDHMLRNNNNNRTNGVRAKLSSSVLYGANRRIYDKHTARKLLERINGHLVVFPTDWLAKEVDSKNWFYTADRLPPIDIYD